MKKTLLLPLIMVDAGIYHLTKKASVSMVLLQTFKENYNSLPSFPLFSFYIFFSLENHQVGMQISVRWIKNLV